MCESYVCVREHNILITQKSLPSVILGHLGEKEKNKAVIFEIQQTFKIQQFGEWYIASNFVQKEQLCPLLVFPVQSLNLTSLMLTGITT